MVPREPLWQDAPYAIKVRAGRMALKMWPHGCDDGTRGGERQTLTIKALDSDYFLEE